MSAWHAAKAKRVYAALLRLEWTLKKQVGSHRKLQRAGWSNFTFCFHDGEEVGPAALSKIGRIWGFGLKVSDPPGDVRLKCARQILTARLAASRKRGKRECLRNHFTCPCSSAV